MIHFRTLRTKTGCSGIKRHSLCIRRWVRRQGYSNRAGERMEGLEPSFPESIYSVLALALIYLQLDSFIDVIE